MKINTQISQHFKSVYFGGNWTTSNLEEQLSDVTWQEAVTAVYGLNTIATLVNHLHYYVRGVTKVLKGGPLETKDKYSFAHPPITNAEEWAAFLAPIWPEAEHFTELIEQLSEEQIGQDFMAPKYGNYYRNLTGIIEHCHYHLGQIVVIKKVIRQQQKNH